MTVLRVDASIRHEGSVSRALTAELTSGQEVVHRDLAAMRGLADAWQDVVLGGAATLVTTLADEVFAADAIVVGAPVYDFGIPVALKAWLGLLIADPRLNPRGGLGTALAGKPVALAVVSGWTYEPDGPRAGWNHAVPYLRRIFADVFGADVSLHLREGTVQKAASPQASV
ncbi:FMN-dependent NADH-azoreductase [Amycolatopsis bartoniae]|uniref:FMN-dependent NADH-azoreductase n=1 Tax=Amycolatopsis bartoniae TaxID=941986 RepID=A0A8H9ME67_9PSEU|nr:NAD(P)H-dependent oxidoreductase [Amycolatopsis bartoniae]MBB2935228.1 FMN-dependent NADH-azoreductase [Amycolatopsis bartoniae]GHF75243.1 FMN-dependent NADH-azoreductase [Amycolatopsis bartoniae]